MTVFRSVKLEIERCGNKYAFQIRHKLSRGKTNVYQGIFTNHIISVCV